VQHPSHTDNGTDRSVLVTSQSDSSSKSVTSLLSACTTVQPVAMKTKKFSVPGLQAHKTPSTLLATAAAKNDEYAQLSKVKAAFEQSTIDGWISRSTYYADVLQTVIPPAAINALMPLFFDNAHSVAMIRHSMDIVHCMLLQKNPVDLARHSWR